MVDGGDPDGTDGVPGPAERGDGLERGQVAQVVAERRHLAQPAGRPLGGQAPDHRALVDLERRAELELHAAAVDVEPVAVVLALGELGHPRPLVRRVAPVQRDGQPFGLDVDAMGGSGERLGHDLVDDGGPLLGAPAG